MSDDREGLWVEVAGYGDTSENYFVDECYELEWNGKVHTYAVLVREQDYETYSKGEEVIPDLLRYSDDKQELEEIEDEDEKAFVVDRIAEHCALEDDSPA